MVPSPIIAAAGESEAILPRAAAIGRYMVVGFLGRGGMGEVYAAYDPELDRKVAIKLLRFRGDEGRASEGRARLMREAQAIAKLSHPNVVTVYDVGAFGGDVFIAMQFVDGNTVGYWMHAQRHSWPDVVKVFAEAGRGLEAAHEKGLIHRDFKPENVMISGDGHVRVMDFGLARVVKDRRDDDRLPMPAGPAGSVLLPNGLDPESTRAAVRESSLIRAPRSVTPQAFDSRLTQTGAMLGTPAYMSPEQFGGKPIDARTDQFSFCVALYEALYGERPFGGTTMILLVDSVIKGHVRAPPRDAKVPSWLRKVVLRGLQRNPEERWPSMTALLAALEQTRHGVPRRRFAADAAAKLAGIWEAPGRDGAVKSAVKAEIHHAFLATGKRYAATAFEKVSVILDSYARAWAGMYTDSCLATHVRGEQSAEVLDLRMAALNDGLESLRALSVVFRRATAEVVENAVTAANALGGVERCADIKLLRAMLRPPDDPETRAAVDGLRTRLAEIRVLCRVGRISEGLKLIDPLEKEARRIGYGPLLAEALFEFGNLHVERRDATGASLALEEAVWTAKLCRHDEIVAKAATQLVYATGALQLRFDAGEIWGRLAETILRRLGGHEELWGWLYNNRGAMRQSQGRLTEAVEDERRAVNAKEKLYGPDGAEVGMSLSNVAICLEDLGEVEAAVTTSERAVRVIEAGLGPEHPRSAVPLSNRAEILNRVGRFAEAREMATRALSIYEGDSALDGVILAYPLMALGLGYLGDGLVEQALPVLERAGTIRDDKEVKSSCLGEVHFALARALSQAGREIPRARALALRARREYAEGSPGPVTRRALEQIDVWLAENVPPAPEEGQPG